MPLAPNVLAPLTQRFQVVLAAIGARSSPRLERIWTQLGSYDEADIERFARLAKPTLTAAKLAAVRQAVGYYSLAAGIRPPSIKPGDVQVPLNMREPFISTWLAFKNGEPFDVAVEAGSSRAGAVARNLVTSSSRRTGDVVHDRAGLKVVRWERVTDADPCPWCMEVAGPGQNYHSAESADFGHDRCGCTVQPVFV